MSTGGPATAPPVGVATDAAGRFGEALEQARHLRDLHVELQPAMGAGQDTPEWLRNALDRAQAELQAHLRAAEELAAQRAPSAGRIFSAWCALAPWETHAAEVIPVLQRLEDVLALGWPMVMTDYSRALGAQSRLDAMRSLHHRLGTPEVPLSRAPLSRTVRLAADRVFDERNDIETALAFLSFPSVDVPAALRRLQTAFLDARSQWTSAVGTEPLASAPTEALIEASTAVAPWVGIDQPWTSGGKPAREAFDALDGELRRRQPAALREYDARRRRSFSVSGAMRAAAPLFRRQEPAPVPAPRPTAPSLPETRTARRT